jgi:hypothetical protein
MMDGERVVFTVETNPQNYLKLVVGGEVDGTMGEALEDYVKRQKRRLGIQGQSKAASPKQRAIKRTTNESGRPLRRPH